MKFCLKFIQLFFIVLLFLLINYNKCNANQNECDLRNLEDILNSVIGCFGYKDHKWPENEREMNIWCKSSKRDATVAKNFVNQCIAHKGWSRAAISAVIYTSSKTNRYFCNNKQQRISYISKGKCGNSAKNGTTNCWREMIVITSNVKKLKNNKDKVPTLCCSYFWVKDCWLNVYKKMDQRVCSKSNIEHMELQIDRASNEAHKLLCIDFVDRDNCIKYIRNFDKSPVEIKFKTPFPASFEALESLQY